MYYRWGKRILLMFSRSVYQHFPEQYNIIYDKLDVNSPFHPVEEGFDIVRPHLNTGSK